MWDFQNLHRHAVPGSTVHVLLYCVSVSQFPFYIYCYIYTVKLVKFVYRWPFPTLNEYKMAAFHSIEKQVHRAQQIANRWNITLMDI